MSLLDARCNLLTCRQAPAGQSVNVYKETLNKGLADVNRFHGGTVEEKISSLPLQDASRKEWTVAQREKIVMEKTLAMLMIKGTDPTKYGTHIVDLSNQHVKGRVPRRHEIGGHNAHGGCRGYGHYLNKCPGASTTGTTLVQLALMLAQSNEAGIDPEWILLGLQSTISVFRNPTMLKDIRRSEHTALLRAITNGGHQDSNVVGDFPNLGEV